jgi:hypothetical protein
MDWLETSAKSGENVLQSFEKLIGIVHDRAVTASQKNKLAGIKGVGGASGSAGGATPGSATGNGTVKLEDPNAPSTDGSTADACGC